MNEEAASCILSSLQIAVVGLGYVGLPLAVAFGEHQRVIAFDVNPQKIELYKQGIDLTREVGNNKLAQANMQFTSRPAELQEANFIIIAVPTPVDSHKNPDLSCLNDASKTVGQNLKRGSIVVYESTVYPGVTEEICVPILETESNLKCGSDFWVGYSPERVNPGDQVHRLYNIAKVVAATDAQALEVIACVYEMVVQAGAYRAPSIRVAEAAKVIENCQRDINIAFVNELSIMFRKMGIDTREVLETAATKWNFLTFSPGLVGGHCIGVDPYYLTYRARQLGYHPEIILAGRRLNDNMPKYVADSIVKQLLKTGSPVMNAKVLIMGFTFKENVPDVRNTKVADMVRELQDYGINTTICDPLADPLEVVEEYGFILEDFEEVKGADAIVIAVSHDIFRSYPLSILKNKLAPGRALLIDVKGIYTRNEAALAGLVYWTL